MVTRPAAIPIHALFAMSSSSQCNLPSPATCLRAYVSSGIIH